MSSEPRIPPLPEDQRDARAREILEGIGGSVSPSMNIFTTLVRHPRLFRRWLPFGGVLLTGTIPARERELVILRTAHLCEAAYEWAHHVEIGQAAGLTDEEVGRVRSGSQDPAWDRFDATLLRAVDELHERACIDGQTWAALEQRFDAKQLIELPMLVGQYHLVAFTLNSLGVQLEGDQDAT